jgi:nucleotide-binding universal stress UspA family protein
MRIASPGSDQRFRRAARETTEEAVAELEIPATVRVETSVAEGHPAKVLTDRSRQTDLVVVGSRGLGGFTGLLLGSVSRQLLHHAHAPVAVIRTTPD